MYAWEVLGASEHVGRFQIKINIAFMFVRKTESVENIIEETMFEEKN